jgi:tRNA(Ile)-lysidine synthase
MLEDFLSYIETNLSVIRDDKILLSISGGIDSMVMLHLFRELDYNISVAHINHSTRKGASDKDLTFVESICKQFSIPFYSKTLSYVELNQGNFQDNARRERYAFLSQIHTEIGSKWIATAHHKNDRWETFLMHLNRKSGIQGLTSLRSQQNQIIHPLLLFTKEEIIAYADQNDIKYVHDVSNDSNDYLRNSIRNVITPTVVNIFPDFIVNVNQSISHLEKDAFLLQELIEKSGLIAKEANSGYTYIELEKLKSYSNPKTLLFHILEKYGFNYSTVIDIIESTKTGAIFQSNTFEALLNRERLIVRLKKERINTNLVISAHGSYRLPSGKLLKIEIGKPQLIEQDLWIDKDKVRWPLTVRNIREGDKFKPHSMKGATKSIKKLCTDLKISRFAKEEILVVCQNEMILQVIGIKSSDNYVTGDIKSAITFRIVE